MPAPVTINIFDEIPGGGRREAFTLELWSERITARELIERRVRHEVDDYNQKGPEYFHGLVQPTDAERVLNGWRLKKARRVDADQQVAARPAVEPRRRSGRRGSRRSRGGPTFRGFPNATPTTSKVSCGR